MRGDTPEFVVNTVQLIAQALHHLHAEFFVLQQKPPELLAWNEADRRSIAVSPRIRCLSPVMLSLSPSMVPGPITCSS
jgi:hypothetical protein